LARPEISQPNLFDQNNIKSIPPNSTDQIRPKKKINQPDILPRQKSAIQNCPTKHDRPNRISLFGRSVDEPEEYKINATKFDQIRLQKYQPTRYFTKTKIRFGKKNQPDILPRQKSANQTFHQRLWVINLV
jgi:hypothetical protein